MRKIKWLFIIGILGILMIDLLLVGRTSHEVSLNEDTIWTAIRVSLAFLLFVFLRFFGDTVHGIDTPE